MTKTDDDDDDDDDDYCNVIIMLLLNEIATALTGRSPGPAARQVSGAPSLF